MIREQIIIGNIRLIGYVSWKIARYYDVDFYELQQYGAEALIESVDRFDFTLGYAFSTYACAYIRGRLFNAVLEMKNLQRGNFSFPYMRAKREVEELHGSTVDDNPALAEEIVDKLIEDHVISPKSKEKMIRRIQLLNAKSANYDEREENDLVSYDTTTVEAEHQNEKDMVNHVLSMLTDMEQNILRDRYGLDDGEEKTQKYCAQKYNITRGRVSQIEAKALRRLRHPSKAKQVKDFVDFDNSYLDFNEHLLEAHKEENSPKHL